MSMFFCLHHCNAWRRPSWSWSWCGVNGFGCGGGWWSVRRWWRRQKKNGNRGRQQTDGYGIIFCISSVRWFIDRPVSTANQCSRQISLARGRTSLILFHHQIIDDYCHFVQLLSFILLQRNRIASLMRYFHHTIILPCICALPISLGDDNIVTGATTSSLLSSSMTSITLLSSALLL